MRTQCPHAKHVAEASQHSKLLESSTGSLCASTEQKNVRIQLRRPEYTRSTRKRASVPLPPTSSGWPSELPNSSTGMPISMKRKEPLFSPAPLHVMIWLVRPSVSSCRSPIHARLTCNNHKPRDQSKDGNTLKSNSSLCINCSSWCTGWIGTQMPTLCNLTNAVNG